jgi:hypothetical protein
MQQQPMQPPMQQQQPPMQQQQQQQHMSTSAMPIWMRVAMVGRLPPQPSAMPVPAAAAQGADVSNMTAVRTTLGLRKGVWLCLERALETDQSRPDPSEGGNCCHWTFQVRRGKKRKNLLK